MPVARCRIEANMVTCQRQTPPSSWMFGEIGRGLGPGAASAISQSPPSMGVEARALLSRDKGVSTRGRLGPGLQPGRRAHLFQARGGALELERAFAVRVEAGWLGGGQHHEAGVGLVEGVDQRAEST